MEWKPCRPYFKNSFINDRVRRDIHITGRRPGQERRLPSRSLTSLTAVALLSFITATSIHACSVPVFRYALDRWPADRYQFEVSPKDAKDEAVAKFLRNFTDSTPLNLAPTRLKEEAPSRLVFPRVEPNAANPWTGALDSLSLAQLTDSPARAEIIRRILGGNSAVWVLVESGDKAADDQKAAAIEKRLRYLEQASQIPPSDPGDPTSQLGPGPELRVKFSLVRVRRDAPAEKAFLKMLAGPNPAPALESGAWLSAIFGRGRALGAWPADSFGNEQIDEVCLFLVGACSCEVKRMNPGWDLLLRVDWDAELVNAEQARLERSAGVPPASTADSGNVPATLEQSGPPATPAAAGGTPALLSQIERIASVKPETVTFSPASQLASAPREPPWRHWHPLLIAAAGLGLFLMLVGAWRTLR